MVDDLSAGPAFTDRVVHQPKVVMTTCSICDELFRMVAERPHATVRLTIYHGEDIREDLVIITYVQGHIEESVRVDAVNKVPDAIRIIGSRVLLASNQRRGME